MRCNRNDDNIVSKLKEEFANDIKYLQLLVPMFIPANEKEASVMNMMVSMLDSLYEDIMNAEHLEDLSCTFDIDRLREDIDMVINQKIQPYSNDAKEYQDNILAMEGLHDEDFEEF